MHGELDHSVHEANPFRRRQAIGIKEKPDLVAAAGGGREKAQPFCDVVVMKLSVQPRGFCQFPEGVNRPGEFPVDERDGDAVLGDDVPRTRITVTEHRMIARQQTSERRLPACVRRWLEGLRSIVQSTHGRVMSIIATLQPWTETIGLLLGGVTRAAPDGPALAGVALAAGLIGMTVVTARPGGDVSRVT